VALFSFFLFVRGLSEFACNAPLQGGFCSFWLHRVSLYDHCVMRWRRAFVVLPSFSLCFNSIQTSLLLNWLGAARRAVILCSGEVVEGTVLEYGGGEGKA